LTHLFVVVLVKKGARRDIEKKVSELLAPYDQQLQVPEYEKVCYCVGSIARHRAYEATDKKFGATESKEASEFEKETFELDPGKSLPEPDCQSCAGTGKYKTTYNPNGEWDWWSFGGRWDRAIQNDWSRTHPHSISHTHELEGNVSTPQFLIDHDIIPAAIVAPDGHWHGKERWKSWEWRETARSIFSKNLDATAVGVDCHA
jgi:hypothetical protein